MAPRDRAHARPFGKVLVANRGEIARRILRAVHAAGLKSVSVYSDADREALHVREAGEAVRIGPPPASESYLRIDRVIEAARVSGADAIHPGYGFLAENPAFARACEGAGLVFIGPTADAIARMGSKARAKETARQAGVPCVPGWQGGQDDASFLSAAERLGYPVMVKASAGGGGRGLRVVEAPEQLGAQLALARAEAARSFGDNELILEKLLIAARHVEVQILADTHGNCLHLGERDCSLQRRHQKVIEECPSPALHVELRERMGRAAVAVARACGYVGAGTVEFLLDAQGKFYFLEANTRLQVEHPVTELVTGVDLVAWQLRIAAGEPLDFSQTDVAYRGHAIEARLYAEDPAHDFMPQTGQVLAWQEARGEGVRVDHAVQEGAEVAPHYDPLLAKVIAWGESREQARERLLQAVRDTVLLGVTTNKGFITAALAEARFAQGAVTTTFVDHWWPPAEGARPDPSPARRVPAHELAIAAIILLQQATGPERPSELSGWRNALPGSYWFRLALAAGQPVELRVRPDAAAPEDRYRVLFAGSALEVDVRECRDGGLSYRQEGLWRRARFARRGSDIFLDTGDGSIQVEDLTYAPARPAVMSNDGLVLATTTGAVVEVLAAPGQTVHKGQAVVVVEAMKMLHHLSSNVDGTVAEVHVRAGEQVRAGQRLVAVSPNPVPPGEDGCD